MDCLVLYQAFYKDDRPDKHYFAIVKGVDDEVEQRGEICDVVCKKILDVCGELSSGLLDAVIPISVDQFDERVLACSLAD